MTQSGPGDQPTLEQPRTGSGALDTGGHARTGQVALELAPEPDGHSGRLASADAADQPGYEWVALSVTTVGALLASLQGSSLVIALPDVLTGLGATFLTVMWVLLGYLLITTALVPVVGRLADMVGRKRLYVAGFAVFTLGSLLAGVSQPQFHGWDLVAYRVLQGVGGALLITNSTAIVADAFRHGRVGLGLGVNQVAGAAGFLLGPVVGGLLTAISWRWVFLINVPLGIFGTLWGIWRLREPVRLPAHQRFDWWGSLTFVVGLGSLLLALSLIAFPMLPMPMVNALFGVGVLGLAGFLVAELRSPQPMLDLRLFSDRLFGFASLAAALNGVARGAVLFVLIFFLQGPYGQDPLMAGLMMTPFGAAFLVVGPLSGYLSDHYGSRLLSTIGLLVSAVGLFGLSTVTASSPYWILAIYMVLMGGGSGLFSSPNVNALMSTVPPQQRGVASGINTMVGNTGQMLSIAIAFPLVLSRIPEDVMFKVFLYGGGMGDVPEALHAFEQGLHQAFLVSFGITLVAALASALRPSHSPREVAAQMASAANVGS
jgi:EmrB/QacA subfamily drug resistance transporter